MKREYGHFGNYRRGDPLGRPDKPICASSSLFNGMTMDPAIPPKENSPQTDINPYTFPAAFAFPAGILQER
jgi:hypothetical protein